MNLILSWKNRLIKEYKVYRKMFGIYLKLNKIKIKKKNNIINSKIIFYLKKKIKFIADSNRKIIEISSVRN